MKLRLPEGGGVGNPLTAKGRGTTISHVPSKARMREDEPSLSPSNAGAIVLPSNK